MGNVFATSFADEIKSDLELLADDKDVLKRWPKLAQVLAALGGELHKIVEAIDDDFSSRLNSEYDEIENDEQFEQESLQKLYRVVENRQGELPL